MKAFLEILKIDTLDVITASTSGGAGENETPDVGGGCIPGLVTNA